MPNLLATSDISHIEKCLDNLEKNGQDLYQNNEHYRSIANCLEHPEFRKFFDTYFSNWDDARTILGFLKVYQEIEQSTPIELSGYQKLAILNTMIRDRDIRRNICNNIVDKTKDVNLLT